MNKSRGFVLTCCLGHMNTFQSVRSWCLLLWYAHETAFERHCAQFIRRRRSAKRLAFIRDCSVHLLGDRSTKVSGGALYILELLGDETGMQALMSHMNENPFHVHQAEAARIVIRSRHRHASAFLDGLIESNHMWQSAQTRNLRMGLRLHGVGASMLHVWYIRLVLRLNTAMYERWRSALRTTTANSSP